MGSLSENNMLFTPGIDLDTEDTGELIRFRGASRIELCLFGYTPCINDNDILVLYNKKIAFRLYDANLEDSVIEDNLSYIIFDLKPEDGTRKHMVSTIGSCDGNGNLIDELCKRFNREFKKRRIPIRIDYISASAYLTGAMLTNMDHTNMSRIAKWLSRFD